MTKLIAFTLILAGCLAPDDPDASEVAQAITYKSCGIAAGDAATGAKLNPLLHAKMAGFMDAEVTACARVIVETVKAHGLDKHAAQIALTTAITESSLHDLTQAVDHDSLGLFQQRPSQGWGTPAQLEDPVYATNAFLNRMIADYPGNGWEQPAIGTVCQRVQVSAVPTAYQVQAADANMMADALWEEDHARSGSSAVIDKYGTYHVFAVDDAGVLQHAFYDTAWHWQSLGGTVTGAPGVTYDPDAHRFDVFAPGTNGQMYQQTYQAGWSGWHSIGGAGFYQGAAAVRDEGGTYHVFAIDGDGVLDQALYAGHGWTWQKIAGTVQGTPGVTYDPSGHRFDVFAPSPNGALYQDTYEGGKWQGFHRIGGANLAAGAGAVIDAAGTYHVFAIDAAGTLVQAIYNAGWTFQNLGGVVTGVPAVTYAAGNRFDVFAPSPNGRLYQKTYQSGWSAWHAIGGANL